MSVCLVVLAVVFSWLFAGDTRRGAGLMPGLVTGIAVAFVFHAISETSRLHRANFAAFWRQVNSGPAEAGRGQMRAVIGGK